MCVKDGVYQRKPRTVWISTTLNYVSGRPVLVSFCFFPPCFLCVVVLIGISAEKDLSSDQPTLTAPPQNYKAAIL